MATDDQSRTLHPNSLSVSETGLELIKRFEPFLDTPQRAPSGMSVIGYRYVMRPADQDLIKMGEQDAHLLLREALRCIEIYINSSVRVALDQHEFDALASLVFDIGMGTFERSDLRAMLNAGDKAGAADALMHWVGPSSSDSLPRRNAEATLFLRGNLSHE